MADASVLSDIVDTGITAEMKRQLEDLAEAKGMSFDEIMHEAGKTYIKQVSKTENSITLHLSSDNLASLQELVEGAKYLLEMYKQD